MTVTILQCNMNGSGAAHALLPQTAAEYDADVLIISEQYRGMTRPFWFSGGASSSALLVHGKSATKITAHGRGEDHVWVRVGAITYVSVYLSPNCTAGEYENKLETIEDALRDLAGDLIVAGDFNARASEWGMPTTNRRGRLLLEMAARLDLAIVNEGTTPTYIRPGYGYSIPDVTMASNRILPWVRGWRVIEDFTASDHQYITFALTEGSPRDRHRGRRRPRWNVKRLDEDKLVECLASVVPPSRDVPRGLVDRDRAEALVERTTGLLRGLCEASMPLKRQSTSRRHVYWWRAEIAGLRHECLSLRRRAQRAKKTEY